MYCLLRLASSGKYVKKKPNENVINAQMKDQICLQTCLGSLQMEDIVVFDEALFLALEIRSDPIEVEVIASIVECRCLAVHIAPVCANLSFLIECSPVRAQKSKVLDLKNADEKDQRDEY